MHTYIHIYIYIYNIYTCVVHCMKSPLEKKKRSLGKSQATAAVWFMAAWKLCSAWLRRCSESRLRAGRDDMPSNMAWENHGKTWRNILQLEVSMGKPTINGHWNGKMVIQLINDDWLMWVELIWLIDCLIVDWLVDWLIDWLVGWLIDYEIGIFTHGRWVLQMKNGEMADQLFHLMVIVWVFNGYSMFIWWGLNCQICGLTIKMTIYKS